MVDGDKVKADWVGEWKGRHCVTTGKGQFDEGDTVNLSKVLCIPTLRNNLFSLTAETTKGAELSYQGKVLVLKCQI